MDDARGDSEIPCGGGHIAAVVLQRFHDQFAFERIDERRERGVAVGEGACFGDGLSGLERRGKIVSMDTVVRSCQDRPFDAVFEFADISRPVVTHHHIDGRRGDSLHGLSVAEVVLLDKMVCERDDIAPTDAQIGQDDREDIQAIVKVFAEFSFCHQLFQIPGSGGDNSDIAMQFLVRADSGERPFLQEAQEFDLDGQGEVSDFIEEQGSAIGGLGAADSACHGTGERTFFMTEDFGFQQIFGKGRAVESDKGAFVSIGESLNGGSHQFLSGSGGSADQDGGIGWCDLTDQGVDLLHFVRIADEFGEGVSCRGQRLPQAFVFFDQRVSLFDFLPARLLSSFLNYYLNKRFVFEEKKQSARSLIRYYILWIVQAIVTALATTGLNLALGGTSGIFYFLVTVFVKCVIFIASYTVQKKWVFAPDRED